MGLDMYLFAKRPGDSPDEREEIAYWRKHPNLHGFIVSNFPHNDPNAPDDNCVPFPLTDENLAAVQDAVRARKLEFTSGFFFGHSYWQANDDSDGERSRLDLEDIAKLEAGRQAIRDGKEVFYYVSY